MKAVWIHNDRVTARQQLVFNTVKAHAHHFTNCDYCLDICSDDINWSAKCDVIKVPECQL